MNRRLKARPHGASVKAPEESFGFTDETLEEARHSAPASERTSAWQRVLGAVRLLAGLALVVGTSLSVAYSVRHYAITSPRFAVREVKLLGGKRISPERARELGGIALGVNSFALDTSAAEHNLLENPWISEARVTRDLPRALRIEIKEREPVALAALGEDLYLVTAEGEPFKRFEAGDPADFPVVTGASIEGIARDRRREVERVARGIEVLSQYQRLTLSKSQPAQEVHVSETGDVALTVGREGITFELGKDHYRRKLLMGEQVVGELRKKGRAPGIVFLDNRAHPERVAVRMR